MTASATPGGALSARLRARARRAYPVDLADVFGLTEPAPVLVRVARAGEDEAAIVDGFNDVDRAVRPLGAEASVAARADDDLLNDAKTRAALALVFRDASDPGSPAFPSATWLGDNCSTDELAALTNIAAEIRRVDARVQVPDDRGVEVLLGLLSTLAEQGHAAPGVVMAPYQREVVTYVLTEAAVKLAADRSKSAELAAELASARERIAVLEAGTTTPLPSELPSEPPPEP